MKKTQWFPKVLWSVVVLVAVGYVMGGEKEEALGWHNALIPAGPTPAELVLIDKGKALYSIVLADQAPSPEVKAAEELARWLAEMSNTAVTVPVVRESQLKADGQNYISVGRTQLLAGAELAAAKNPLGDEGYGIAVKGNNLYVWGGRTRGPVNAVFALLEEDMGCRWYTDKHFRIPKSDRVAVRPAERTYQPPFILRDPFHYVSFNAEWSIRNRTNAPSAAVGEEYGGRVNPKTYFLGGANDVVPKDKYFKDHPDYYMVNKEGKRVPDQLCSTHPDVIRIVTEKVLADLKENPTIKIVNLFREDGYEICRCERCKALEDAEGTHMAPVLVLVNGVAEAVEKEHPYILINTLAYVTTVRPPKTMHPRKNVIIQMCNDDVGSWEHPFTPAEQCEFGKIVKEWAAIHDNLSVWDYTINFNHYLAPMPNFSVVAENIRFYADNHVHGVMTQANYNTPGADREWMRCWVFAKLMWNPRLDYRELMKDFIFGHYGAASELIWKYNELLEGQAIKFKDALAKPLGGIRFKIYSPHLNSEFLDQASKLFDRAEAAAGSDQALLERVQLARLPVLYIQLMQGLECANDACPDTMIDKFEKIAKREHITQFTEGYMHQFDDQLGVWRQQWQERKNK
jgi:hypothetical protein